MKPPTRDVLTLPEHECETILDLSRYMSDGSEVGGHQRAWKVGRLLEKVEGAPDEKWCLHIRTAWKPEIVFAFNEADWNFLAVSAYAALGYHTNPEWVEAIACKVAVNDEDERVTQGGACPMSDWRPIETSPKAGAPVLLHEPGRGIRTEVVGWWSMKSGGWICESGRLNPTHWMPLPPPDSEPRDSSDSDG